MISLEYPIVWYRFHYYPSLTFILTGRKQFQYDFPMISQRSPGCLGPVAVYQSRSAGHTSVEPRSGFWPKLGIEKWFMLAELDYNYNTTIKSKYVVYLYIYIDINIEYTQYTCIHIDNTYIYIYIYTQVHIYPMSVSPSLQTSSSPVLRRTALTRAGPPQVLSLWKRHSVTIWKLNGTPSIKFNQPISWSRFEIEVEKTRLPATATLKNHELKWRNDMKWRFWTTARHGGCGYVYVFVCLFVCLSVCLSICLSVCLG